MSDAVDPVDINRDQFLKEYQKAAVNLGILPSRITISSMGSELKLPQRPPKEPMY